VGERVTPLGAPTRERETVPVKPPCGVMVRVVVPLCPGWTLRLVGLRERVKSGDGGGGGAVTTTVRFTALVRLPLVALTWRV
jgi:hypothetical protein